MKYSLLILALLTSTTLADTINVPGDYPTIQAAVAAASDDDEIIVMPGTYTMPTQGGITISNRLYLRSSDGPSVTFITSSYSTGFGLLPSGGGSSGTTIEGFTFTEFQGGGSSIRSESTQGVTVRDCVFTNSGGVYGIRLHSNYGVNLLYENCYFSGNADTSIGIDNSSVVIRDCHFENNVGFSIQSWVESSSTISNCEFIGNTGNDPDYDGGAIKNDRASNMTITDCLFSGNFARNGGAVWNDDASSWGDSTLSITNCRFEYNVAKLLGGAIKNDGLGKHLTVTDSVFCVNSPDHISGPWTDNGGNGFYDFCDDQDGDGVADGKDNCDLYNPDQADCNGNGVGDVCDLADGSSDDINSDEVPDECQCLADINTDGNVNINDILTLIANWGSTSDIGDVNYDGIVDISDLLYVISSWGPCN